MARSWHLEYAYRGHGRKTIGGVIISDSCGNTHVINELDIPIVVMGAKDIVAAASHDVILVSDKV